MSIYFETGRSAKRGGVRVCGDAVLRYFWCGFAVIFILTRGIAVSKHVAVCGYYNLWVVVFGEKKVSAVMTLFRTVGIRLLCKREPSVSFYNASTSIISVVCNYGPFQLIM